jgi:hypothetical protein
MRFSGGEGDRPRQEPATPPPAAAQGSASGGWQTQDGMGQVGCDELGRRRRVVLHTQKAARPRRWRSPPPARPSTGGSGGETGGHGLGSEQNGIPGAAPADLRASSRTRARGGQGRGRSGAGPGECPSRRPPAGATPAARRTELLSACTAAGRPALEPPAARGGGPTFVPYRKETARVRTTSPPRSGPVPPARPGTAPAPGHGGSSQGSSGPRPRRQKRQALVILGDLINAGARGEEERSNVLHLA